MGQLQAENIRLEDKFISLYADKGQDDILGDQMKETVCSCAGHCVGYLLRASA